MEDRADPLAEPSAKIVDVAVKQPPAVGAEATAQRAVALFQASNPACERFSGVLSRLLSSYLRAIWFSQRLSKPRLKNRRMTSPCRSSGYA